MTSSRAATDTSHRVPYPNARPRRIKLLGLGSTGQRVAVGMVGPDMAHVDIVPDASTRDESLAGADMIFIVLGRGEDGSEASAVGELARGMGTLVTGVVIDRVGGNPAVGEQGLDRLREACDMLVITSEPEDLRAMLSSLGTLPQQSPPQQQSTPPQQS